MEIAEAIQIAESDGDVQEHIKNGYHLSSLMAIPETLAEIRQWTLVYSSRKEQKVFSVEAGFQYHA